MCVNKDQIIRCACKCNCSTCNPEQNYLTKMIKAGVKIFTAKNALNIANSKQEQYAIERFAHVMERIQTHAGYGSTSISYERKLYPEMITALTELGYTVGELEYGRNRRGLDTAYRVISWES